MHILIFDPSPINFQSIARPIFFKIKSVLTQNSAKRFFQELKSEMFMFKIESETQHFKGNYGSPFLAVHSF